MFKRTISIINGNEEKEIQVPLEFRNKRKIYVPIENVENITNFEIENEEIIYKFDNEYHLPKKINKSKCFLFCKEYSDLYDVDSDLNGYLCEIPSDYKDFKTLFIDLPALNKITLYMKKSSFEEVDENIKCLVEIKFHLIE